MIKVVKKVIYSSLTVLGRLQEQMPFLAVVSPGENRAEKGICS